LFTFETLAKPSIRFIDTIVGTATTKMDRREDALLQVLLFINLPK